MENKPLSSAEKKELRGIAQRLKPHIHIGKQGLSETVLSEIETALKKNGLIKIRFETERATMKQLSTRILSESGCDLVGSVGKTAVFFRDMPEDA